jgi:hypothetical protein
MLAAVGRAAAAEALHGFRHSVGRRNRFRARSPRPRRELTLMEKLSGCPRVVQLLDVYEDAEHVYIVQEACHGGDLQKFLDVRAAAVICAGPAEPPARGAKCFSQIWAACVAREVRLSPRPVPADIRPAR